MLAAPRTDPDVRLSRIRLLPEVRRDRRIRPLCRTLTFDPCEGGNTFIIADVDGITSTAELMIQVDGLHTFSAGGNILL